ncbi:hypothetical protein H4582DRAFT_2036870 [Lactarius indigo]|nr:hypothetical protein H4582DRAFT_2036870 [Lactarius indigo]
MLTLVALSICEQVGAAPRITIKLPILFTRRDDVSIELVKNGSLQSAFATPLVIEEIRWVHRAGWEMRENMS